MAVPEPSTSTTMGSYTMQRKYISPSSVTAKLHSVKSCVESSSYSEKVRQIVVVVDDDVISTMATRKFRVAAITSIIIATFRSEHTLRLGAGVRLILHQP